MGRPIEATDLAGVFAKHERFVILSHTRPDGDAIGSQLAMKAVLEAMGKQAQALNEDRPPEYLAAMSGIEGIEQAAHGQAPVEAEVVLALDTANRERLGENCLAAVSKVPLWVNIDHHLSNERYGDLILLDTDAAATGEILYSLVKTLDLPLPDVARDALYVAVSTDTGSFQYSNTRQQTHEMAADLVGRGAPVGAPTTAIYQSHPFRRVELLRALLSTLERSEDGRVAWWSLTNEVKEQLGVQAGDSEGLIDILRGVDGVIVCASFEETSDGKVRLSMRSKSPDVNVSEICGEFGGGGHAAAAGARLRGPLDEARRRVIAVVERVVGAS